MKTAEQPRKVLITGGTGSVGKALVEAFAATRASVWFQYCNDAATAKKLQADFGANPIQLNFTKSFILPAIDFDIVVNNAGINISDVPAHEVTVDAWNQTLQVNLTAPFQLLKQCLPSMVRNRWGRVINISSIYGIRAVEGNFPYTVSKHGLCGLTKTIAKEYAPHGITCNEICPGPIDSDMMREIGSKAVANTPKSLNDYLDEVSEEVPAKRMARPQEIAALAVFLASQEAGYINGASIPVDGALIA
jgi:3-hydroxybutyrate dehydrogenase